LEWVDCRSFLLEFDWIGDWVAKEILIFGAELELDKMGRTGSGSGWSPPSVALEQVQSCTWSQSEIGVPPLHLHCPAETWITP
jgi:hypothetical protein